MSFGFSIGDFVTLSAFAWQVYKSCKDSSVDFQSLSQDVASLHIILKESVEQIQDQQIQTGRREQLTTLCDNCRNVLTDISACLEKYESLGTQSQRAWDRMRWGLEDIACLRQRLLTTINLLTAFNTSIAKYVAFSLGRISAQREEVEADSWCTAPPRSVLRRS